MSFHYESIFWQLRQSHILSNVTNYKNRRIRLIRRIRTSGAPKLPVNYIFTEAPTYDCQKKPDFF
ncbi:hypothetical protein HanRHA438_Chr04g0176941 [Helianthus annuus]|nr:hypothetical protein HanRHA438_Chr04g0176941 [Helianthus annuus]